MKTTCGVMEREDRGGLIALGGLQAVAERVVAAMSAEAECFTSSAQENLGHLEEKVTALARQLVREAAQPTAQPTGSGRKTLASGQAPRFDLAVSIQPVGDNGLHR